MLLFLRPFCLFYGQTVFLRPFGTCFLVLVCCFEKNLATLVKNNTLALFYSRGETKLASRKLAKISIIALIRWKLKLLHSWSEKN
jgi:hypothetical protein